MRAMRVLGLEMLWTDKFLNTGKKIGSGPARNATGIKELDQLS
jgi:hypothetical protein